MAADQQLSIILLTELYPPFVGGSAEMFHNIYSRISGVPVTLVSGTAAALSSPALPYERNRYIRIEGRERGFTSVRAISQHVRVARVVRAECRREPAVVHCARALPEGIAGLTARTLFGVPGYVCWIMGEEVASALLSREYSIALKTVYNRARVLFSITQNSKAYVERLGVDPTKIRVVYSGVDSTRFSPSVDGRGVRERLGLGDEILVLSVGRLQARKGHDLVIKALSLIDPAQGRPRYVIVGDGEERSRLGEMVEQLRLAPWVTFAGVVPADDLPTYYAAADMFAMPNRIEGTDFEGFGLVFLEAAAAGKPAIGGTTGGAREAIADGRTGILVSGTDAGELARVISLLASDSALRQRLGREGRLRVEREFTWESAARQVEQIQQEIASP